MPIQNLQNALLINDVANLSITDLEQINLQFPYCSISQIMLSSKLGKQNTQQLQTAGLYKGNPVIFSNHFKQVVKSIEKVQTQTLPIVEPVSSSDYFAQQNIKIDSVLDTAFIEAQNKKQAKNVKEIVAEANDKNSTETQNILVTKSFNDWLLYFKQKKEQDDKEAKSKEALTAMLQHQKLTAAAGEENEVIPDAVFKQAISSISPQENLATEALAEILVNQGKTAQAKEMYAKLSLKYPEKSAYFASKLKNL